MQLLDVNQFFCCRYVEADPTWAKNLEWEVPAGYTQVTFTARSPISNDTATCRFKIHVIGKNKKQFLVLFAKLKL